MNRLRIFYGCAALLLSLLPAAPARAEPLYLYDGETHANPVVGGWLAYGDNSLFEDYTASPVGAGATRLNTLTVNGSPSSAAQAGYSNYTIFGAEVNGAFPALDRATGFVVEFVVKVDSESHDNGNRAGFSVIVLGSDKKGIELGFWQDQIFAQHDGITGPLFTKAESGALNTTGDYISYSLAIGPTGYALSQHGQPVVNGAIRDYAAFVPPFGPDPYELPNYLFVGDNTTSARANVDWASLSVTVPEPSAMVLGIVGLSLAGRSRQRSNRG